jgi:hypothetical protein
LVWRSGIRHGRQNKVTIQFVYVPYARISKILECERGDTSTLVEWNVYKNFSSQMDVKQPTIKNHLEHKWETIMALTFLIFLIHIPKMQSFTF